MLINKLNSIITTPWVQWIVDKIKAFDINPQNDHNSIIPQMQWLFAEIHDVDATNFSSKENAIWWYINQLEWLYNQYEDAKNLIEADSIEARDGFIPNEFLTQSDSIFYRHIRDRLASAESWSTEEILEATQWITIQSDNISSEDWDDFFDDLRDEIPSWERSDFDTFVTNFRENNPNFYDDSRLNLRLWDDIERMSWDLDNILSELSWLPDILPEWQVIEIPVGWLETTFEWPNAKRTALLYILKVKMVFAELANSQENILKSIFWFWVWWNTTIIDTSWDDVYGELPTTGLSWIIPALMTIAWIYAFNLTMFAPAESAFRWTKDFLTVRFWNNNVVKLFSWIGRLWHGIQSTSARSFWRIPLVWWLIHAPFGFAWSALWVIGWAGDNLFQWVESAYLDQTINSVNYTVIDGLVGTEAWEFDKNEEAIKRVRVLEYYKNKWHFDAERLERFESLRWRNGIIASRTETYWMRVWEIDQWQYIRTNRWATWRENALIRWENIGRQTIRTFTIPQFREEVLNDFNKNVNRAAKLLNVIFERVTVPTDGGSIEISDSNSKFYNEVITYLDLESSISNAEEILREWYLMELIDHIKQWKIRGTEMELRQEIVRIIKWLYPQFKSLEKLSLEIENSTDNAAKWRLMKFMDMISKWKWTGTLSEFDTAIDEIEQNIFNFNEKIVTINQTEIDRVQNKWVELSNSKFDETLTTADAFTDHFQREIESHRIQNNLDQSQRETRVREIWKLFKDMKWRKVWDKTTTVDYTHWQVNYIIQRILWGDNYAQASNTLTTETWDIEIDYDRDIILDKERRSLVWTMRAELEWIQTQSDVTIKNEKFTEFKDRFDLLIQDSGTMRDFARKDNDFRNVIRLYSSINAEIWVGLQRFITVEWNRVIWKAAELLDTAEKMSPDKKAIVTELRNKITLHPNPISISQLENVLRSIISWDIEQSDINALDFNIYTDDTNLSSEAREIRIIEARQVSIIDSDTWSNRAISIIYTDDSQFTDIIANWNNYTELRQKLEDFQDNLRQQETLTTRIASIDTEIQWLRTRISRAPNQLIWVEPVNIEALERDITALQADRTANTDRLDILRARSSSIQVSSRIRNMSLKEVSRYIETEDTSFRSSLVSNKWFQDYVSRNNIGRTSHSTEKLWKDFISYAQNNTIKSGWSLDTESMNLLTQNTSWFTENEWEAGGTNPENTPRIWTDLLNWNEAFEDDKTRLSQIWVDPDEYFRDILDTKFASFDDAWRAVGNKLINDWHLIQWNDNKWYWPSEEWGQEEAETRTTTWERLLFKENWEIRENWLWRAFQQIQILMEIHPEWANDTLFDSLRTQEFSNKDELVTEVNKLLESNKYEWIKMSTNVNEIDLQTTRKLQTLDMMARVVYLTNFNNQKTISEFELKIWQASDSNQVARIQWEIYGFLVQSWKVNKDEPIPSLQDIMSRNTTTLTPEQEAAMKEINEYRTNTNHPTVWRLLDLFKRAMWR